LGIKADLILLNLQFYNDNEAQKYTKSSRIQSIQSEMTERCLELLNLPSPSDDGDCDYSALLLDIGCGSGLSGEIITEHGHQWVGADISGSMLGQSQFLSKITFFSVFLNHYLIPQKSHWSAKLKAISACMTLDKGLVFGQEVLMEQLGKSSGSELLIDTQGTKKKIEGEPESVKSTDLMRIVYQLFSGYAMQINRPTHLRNDSRRSSRLSLVH
jgi:hypothetical protein